ncbi:dethiobiotin synthase, partial [Blastomonas fulva]
MTRFVVTGTDTGIGKTIFSAALAQATGTPYWKPIQSGLEEETDSEAVARLAGVPIRPEAYRLITPASPHLAAEIDGVNIELETLTPPTGNLIVEGAGGALVPVTRTTLYADLFARWQIPVIVCARTALG